MSKTGACEWAGRQTKGYAMVARCGKVRPIGGPKCQRDDLQFDGAVESLKFDCFWR